MNITWIGMTRPHYTPGQPGRIRCLVIHATAGTNSLGWLRKGGHDTDPKRWVSCHYLIDKAGRISHLVRDDNIAWHAGVSRWEIDGELRESLNSVSVGIEIENLNDGRDPYPEAQLAAAAALSRHLVRAYAIPRAQLVRHLDISPGRKSDPAPPAFDWPEFVSRVYPATAVAPPAQLPHAYTELSPLLGPTRATLDQAIAYVLRRSTGEYTRHDIAQVILPAYWSQCAALGIPAEVALAQCIHETDNFNAALAQRRDRQGRNLRNPAGIGVFEGRDRATPHYRPGTVWDADVRGYRPACQFADWVRESIPAQLGRLLAYALPAGAPLDDARRAALVYALRVRSLPDHGRGTARTLKALGRDHNPQGHRGIGWASPGDRYGAAIARIATEITTYGR